LREYWEQKKRERSVNSGVVSSAQYWSNVSTVREVYQKQRASDTWSRKVQSQIEELKILSGSQVLDIGAGTGTLAVSLATRGCRVTAIEPSLPMREGFLANEREAGVSDIRIIPQRWEDISEQELGGPFDAVIASYSLTMTDIGAAIAKMQACCTGTVHLFWFLTPPSWARVSYALWPKLHGANYTGEPLADCLWQVLNEMGIRANLTAEHPKSPTRYALIDDVVAEYRQRLNCSTAKQDACLLEWFEKNLVRSADGYELPGNSRGAHIWWNVTDSPQGSARDKPSGGKY